MKFLGDHRRRDRHARTVHIINEEIEKQEDSDIKTLALIQRCDTLEFRFSGRLSSLFLGSVGSWAMRLVVFSPAEGR